MKAFVARPVSTRAAPLALGLLSIALGLALNTRTLGYFLATDAAIDALWARTAIALGEITAITLGIYLVVRLPAIPLRHLAFIALSCPLGLLLAVAVVQIVYTPPIVVSGWRATIRSELEKNQLGYRGHPIAYSARDFVILLLGDSQVEALSCSYAYLPERRLEYHLRSRGKEVRVFTVGASGYGQDQQLLGLRAYYRQFRADLLLLWQTPKNDVWNNLFPTHWPTNAKPKPTFWLERGSLRGPTEEIGEQLRFPALKILTLLPRLRHQILRRDSSWENRLPQPYRPLKRYDGTANQSWQQMWDEDYRKFRYENLEIEKTHLAIFLTPRSKRMQYGIRLTRLLLQEIERTARAHGGRLVIFSVSTGRKESFLVDGVYGLNGKYYRVAEEQFQENLQDINRGFTTFKMQVELANPEVGPEDPHLNEHATDEAMGSLAHALSDMIPDRRKPGGRHGEEGSQ